MIKFGTGGWRAVIADEFTRRNVQILAAALARKMRDEGVAHKGIVIGYDRRFLSDVAARWAAEVLAGEGVPVRLIPREAPTPLIMYAVDQYDMDYGMAITASHNPAIYNGIKVFTRGGRDADELQTADIERHIAQVDPDAIALISYEEGLRSGMIRESDPMNEYIDAIIAAVDMEAIRRKGLKVVLDPMYGVSRTALQTILLTARCDVDVIHERRDALFGGRLPAPNVSTLAALKDYVLEKGCDIGIATDGDADRLGVIDDEGEFLHPNKILVLLYYYLTKYRGWRGDCVRNLATTHLLDRIADSFGQSCHEVPVGFKHISAKMLETGAIIGGESSGGLTVRGHIQGKDGIYAGSLLVEMVAVTGLHLSQIYRSITDDFGTLEMVERDYAFTQEKKEQVMGRLMVDKLLPEFSQGVEKVSYADGCKVYFKNGGWVIGRFSGTEPLLRIFCEMPSLSEAEATADRLETFLALDRAAH